MDLDDARKFLEALKRSRNGEKPADEETSGFRSMTEKLVDSEPSLRADAPNVFVERIDLPDSAPTYHEDLAKMYRPPRKMSPQEEREILTKWIEAQEKRSPLLNEEVDTGPRFSGTVPHAK